MTASITSLIEAFRTRARAPREKARDDLLALGRGAIPPLIDALRTHPKASVRSGAAMTLGAFGGDEVIEPLAHALIDAGDTVQEAALDALRPLCLAITDPARQEAIAALIFPLLDPVEDWRVLNLMRTLSWLRVPGWTRILDLFNRPEYKLNPMLRADPINQGWMVWYLFQTPNVINDQVFLLLARGPNAGLLEFFRGVMPVSRQVSHLSIGHVQYNAERWLMFAGTDADRQHLRDVLHERTLESALRDVERMQERLARLEA